MGRRERGTMLRLWLGRNRRRDTGRNNHSSSNQSLQHRKIAECFAASTILLPRRYAQGLRESHQLHVWYPIDTVTGEADYTVDLSELGLSDVDEEAVSDCCFYCPTCNDTFSELVDIE